LNEEEAMTTDIADPRLDFVSCLDPSGLHRMAYWEWGARDNPRVVVCVHGLTRQGRDFDTLARALAPDWRVVCPDVVGRGRSDWLAEPMAYQVPTYVADMVTLLARLGAEQVDWVGTSMGGLIGLGLASLHDRAGRSPGASGWCSTTSGRRSAPTRSSASAPTSASRGASPARRRRPTTCGASRTASGRTAASSGWG
jgi:pimeloyl-ACP methyl ester carboxylesterase